MSSTPTKVPGRIRLGPEVGGESGLGLWRLLDSTPALLVTGSSRSSRDKWADFIARERGGWFTSREARELLVRECPRPGRAKLPRLGPYARPESPPLEGGGPVESCPVFGGTPGRPERVSRGEDPGGPSGTARGVDLECGDSVETGPLSEEPVLIVRALDFEALRGSRTLVKETWGRYPIALFGTRELTREWVSEIGEWSGTEVPILEAEELSYPSWRPNSRVLYSDLRDGDLILVEAREKPELAGLLRLARPELPVVDLERSPPLERGEFGIGLLDIGTRRTLPAHTERLVLSGSRGPGPDWESWWLQLLEGLGIPLEGGEVTLLGGTPRESREAWDSVMRRPTRGGVEASSLEPRDFRTGATREFLEGLEWLESWKGPIDRETLRQISEFGRIASGGEDERAGSFVEGDRLPESPFFPPELLRSLEKLKARFGLKRAFRL